ncbi:MAG: efflux RND transporter periplasmic adaptor subunit [Bdellovibrionota bacterium]
MGEFFGKDKLLKLSSRQYKFFLIGLVLVVVFVLMLRKSGSRNDFVVSELKHEFFKQFTIYTDGIGQIRSLKEYYLSVNKGGRLEILNINEGMQVKKDQILAVVDQTTNKAKLKSALSSFKLADQEFNRAKRLYKTNAITKQEYDEANTNLIVKQAVLEESRQNLEDSIIRAPIDGVVSLIAFQQGELVPDGSRILIVEDRSKYKISIRLKRTLMENLLKHGQTKVSMAPYDTYTSLTDEKKTVVLDAEVAILNADSKYDGADLDAEIFIKDLPLGFNVGMGVIIKIPVKTFENIYAMDKDSLFVSNDITYFLVKNSKGELELNKLHIVGETKEKFLSSDDLGNFQVLKLENRQDKPLALKNLPRRMNIAAAK